MWAELVNFEHTGVELKTFQIEKYGYYGTEKSVYIFVREVEHHKTAEIIANLL